MRKIDKSVALVAASHGLIVFLDSGGDYYTPDLSNDSAYRDLRDSVWIRSTPGSANSPVEDVSTSLAAEYAAVPRKVSKAQLKLSLFASGIDLAALIAQLPAQEQPAAQILIDDATHFERSAGMVEKLRLLAGLTEAEVDALFIAAAQINPAEI